MSPVRARRRLFTLVEIVITLVVLGVLSAIAVIGYGSLVSRSSDETTRLAMVSASKYAIGLARADDAPELSEVFTTAAVGDLDSGSGGDPFVVVDGPSHRYGQVSVARSIDGYQASMAMRTPSGRCVFTHFSLQGTVVSWIDPQPTVVTPEFCAAVGPIIATGGETPIPPAEPAGDPVVEAGYEFVQVCRPANQTARVTLSTEDAVTAAYRVSRVAGDLTLATGTLVGPGEATIDTAWDPSMAGQVWRAEIGPTTIDLVVADIGMCDPFAWDGFFAPILNLPAVNNVNAGQTINAGFSLGSYQGLEILAAGYPASQQVFCDTVSEIADLELIESPGNSPVLVHEGVGVYRVHWKTDKDWRGDCRRLVVKLTDGSQHWAYFKFKDTGNGNGHGNG